MLWSLSPLYDQDSNQAPCYPKAECLPLDNASPYYLVHKLSCDLAGTHALVMAGMILDSMTFEDQFQFFLPLSMKIFLLWLSSACTLLMSSPHSFPRCKLTNKHGQTRTGSRKFLASPACFLL